MIPFKEFSKRYFKVANEIEVEKTSKIKSKIIRIFEKDLTKRVDPHSMM